MHPQDPSAAMPEEAQTLPHPTDSDRLTRFLLDRPGVRGVRVHLGDSWTQIRERDDYPLAVAELLGEATAAPALFTGPAQVDGPRSVQDRKRVGTGKSVYVRVDQGGTSIVTQKNTKYEYTPPNQKT